MKARRYLACALCLLLGFVVQTFVAWALFVRSEYTGGSGVLNDPVLKVGSRTATGFTVPADWGSRTRVEWWGLGKTRETVSECVWMGSTLGMTSGGGRQATYNGFAAGWPCRSLWGSDYLTPGVQSRIPAPLVDVPAWIKAGGYKVPIEPKWGGLIVNTLVFALPFALAVGWREWVLERRRLRGWCLRCGYDASGLPRCPECGAALAEEST